MSPIEFTKFDFPAPAISLDIDWRLVSLLVREKREVDCESELDWAMTVDWYDGRPKIELTIFKVDVKNDDVRGGD